MRMVIKKIKSLFWAITLVITLTAVFFIFEVIEADSVRTIKISGGFTHSMVIDENRALWAWGTNEYGEIGDGTLVAKSSPIRTNIGSDWLHIAAGIAHSAGIKPDGSLWTWGGNDTGALGDGSTVNSQIPTQVGTGTDWINTSAGSGFTLALNSGGALWSWGENSAGQLGDGTDVDKHSPTKVGIDDDWVSISAGFSHSMGIKSDGTLWGWGLDIFGQLGMDGLYGSWPYVRTPTQVGTDTDWLLVSCGTYHTLALKSDGTLWAWGLNNAGQLGDGTGQAKDEVTQVGSSSEWTSISASMHNMALKSDGTLWAWGFNNKGQLGDGTVISKNIPTQIGSDSDWSVVAVGLAHSMAVKSDGTLWTWGNNEFGTLGDGTNADRHTAVKILLQDDSGLALVKPKPTPRPRPIVIPDSDITEVVAPGLGVSSVIAPDAVTTISLDDPDVTLSFPAYTEQITYQATLVSDSESCEGVSPGNGGVVQTCVDINLYDYEGNPTPNSNLWASTTLSIALGDEFVESLGGPAFAYIAAITGYLRVQSYDESRKSGEWLDLYNTYIKDGERIVVQANPRNFSTFALVHYPPGYQSNTSGSPSVSTVSEEIVVTPDVGGTPIKTSWIYIGLALGMVLMGSSTYMLIRMKHVK
tara:strand:+ start:1665 stop:3584 length:1920 start_codon:yes stop_codon:yes gene_type:complete